MSQNAARKPGLPAPVPAVSEDEDAGRLNHASNARIWAILIILVVFAEIVPMQYVMIGLSLPKIGSAFPTVGTNVTWSLTILGVVGAATLPLCGKASDLWGKKRTLLVLAVFLAVGTLVCALTSNWAVFLVGRGLMATAFCMTSVAYGVVRDLIPRRLIPVALGIVATGLGASAVLAPVIGGLLTDHYSWRSIFWFLLIYLAVTGLLLIIVVPESPYRVRQRLDWLGSVLIGFGLAGVLIYVSEGTSWGWGLSSNLLYLIGGVVLLAVFLLWESRIANPLIEVSLLRDPSVAIMMAISVFATLAIALAQITVPYMFETPTPAALKVQILAGVSAKEHLPVSLITHFITFNGNINYAAGFSIFQVAWHINIFLSVSGMIFGLVGGFLARRYNPRLVLILGGVAFAVTYGLWTPWHGAWVDQAVIGIGWGIGFGFFFAGGINILVDKIPARRQGIGAAMYNSFGAVGSALGVALFTPIAAAHPFELIGTPPGGKPQVQAIPQVYTNTAYSETYLFVGVVTSLLVLILALAMRAGRTPARGGIVLDVPFDVEDVPFDVQDAPIDKATAAGAPASEAPVNGSTLNGAQAGEAPMRETPAQEAAPREA